MNYQPYDIRPLRGVDERWTTKPNSAGDIRDMTWTQNETWRDSGGIRQIVPDTGGGNPFDGEGRISSLHWFSQHNGARQWLMWETGGGALRYFHGPTPASPWLDVKDTNGNVFDGSTRSRTIVQGPWQKTQSAGWGGRLMLVNGIDEPLVFNGRYADRAGFATTPPAPSATSLTNVVTTRSGGAVPENWTIGVSVEIPDTGLGRISSADTETVKCGYQWKITFVNERGQESAPSASSDLVVITNGDSVETTLGPPLTGTSTGKSFALVQLPKGDSSVVARRVYRTRNVFNSDGQPLDLGFGANFYFHSEIQDNVCSSFEDGLPDTSLGSLLDELDFGTFPLQTKLIAVFKNTLFTVGPDNNIRFSAPLRPEVFPVDNVLPVGDSDASQPMAMYSTKNALVVFKMRGIYLIKGDPASGFYAQTLTKDTGCIAANSVRELPGIGLVFLGNDGVHVLQGALENTGTPTAVTNISQPILETMKRLNKSAAINACGEVYHKDKEYWLSIPTIGSSDNNIVLIFHYEIGEWSFKEDIPANTMVESHDHRGYLFIGSNDQTDKPGVLVYSNGWPNKLNGDEISPMYETTDLDFSGAINGAFYKSAQPKYFMVQAIGAGNNTMNVNYTANQTLDPIRVEPSAVEQQDLSDRLNVYGSAKWNDGARWGKRRPIVIRYDTSVSSRGPVRDIYYTIEAAGRRIEIVGFSIGLAVGEQRNQNQLSSGLKPDKG